MKLSRRTFLHLVTGSAALPALWRFAGAQAYPARPVRIIVGFAAGGPTDILARLAAQWLSERLGQQFVVDNRPGASGNIGTETVVRAPADGYSLLFAMSANAINATLFDNLRFSFMRDTVPVALVGRGCGDSGETASLHPNRSRAHQTHSWQRPSATDAESG